jgi:hypothetical protein
VWEASTTSLGGNGRAGLTLTLDFWGSQEFSELLTVSNIEHIASGIVVVVSIRQGYSAGRNDAASLSLLGHNSASLHAREGSTVNSLFTALASLKKLLSEFLYSKALTRSLLKFFDPTQFLLPGAGAGIFLLSVIDENVEAPDSGLRRDIYCQLHFRR